MAGKGKVIILTGASRGIGLAIAQYLLKQQCNLVVTARTQGALEKLRHEYPGQVECLTGDMADMSTGPKAVELAKSKFKTLDGLVINHGILEPMERIATGDVQEWRKAFDINYFSAVSLVQAALPALRASKGRVIFVSSGAATNAYATWGAYGSSKAAMNHLNITLAVEEPDVTFVSIRPGTVDTAMQVKLRGEYNSKMDKKDAEHFANLPNNGKLLRTDQPGNVIAKLALDAPKDLSGQFLAWNDSEVLAKYQE